MVSSKITGPRGENGASPFMYAHPERDIDSTPHATATPRSPALIAWANWTVALNDEAQNRLIVAPATLSGKPAASAAHRATSPMPSCAGLTQPAITSSIWSSSTPTRSHAPLIANPSRSSSRICDSEPPYRVNGVRTPPSTNASVIVDSQRSCRTTDVTHDLDRLVGHEGCSSSTNTTLPSRLVPPWARLTASFHSS